MSIPVLDEFVPFRASLIGLMIAMVWGAPPSKRGRKRLNDDDPTLDPATLKNRLKKRRHDEVAAQRKAAAEVAAQLGQPSPPPPPTGRPRKAGTLANQPTAPIPPAFGNLALEFDGAVAAAALVAIGRDEEQRRRQHAALTAENDETIERLLTEAADQAAAEKAAADEAERAEAERAEVEQAAAEKAAAEKATAEAAAVAKAAAAAEAAAKAEAGRLRLKRRLEREMEADRGYVDSARIQSEPRLQHACFVCMDSDLPTDSYMPCCRHHVHRACIARWHGMGQNKTKHQAKAPKQDGGWKPVDMARLHQCPHCSAEMLSARLPSLP
jgi:flagellar biosynthesis GTPase FlhF